MDDAPKILTPYGATTGFSLNQAALRKTLLEQDLRECQPDVSGIAMSSRKPGMEIGRSNLTFDNLK